MIATAMSEDRELDAVLATAEDALAREVIRKADIGEAWAAVHRRIERVRPYCRQLRVSLAKLDASRTVENTVAARSHCRDLRIVIRELNLSAKIEFHCEEATCSLLETPRTTCWKATLKDMLPNPLLEQLAFGTDAHRAGPDPVMSQSVPAAVVRIDKPKAIGVPPSLLRQTVDLAALVASYLQYYFIDVYLQIVCLPTLFPH